MRRLVIACVWVLCAASVGWAQGRVPAPSGVRIVSGDTRAMALKYVALTGSNAADGSIGTPWQTLRYAVAQLTPGDTLYIRGGTYTGATNTIDSALGTVPSGTNSTTGLITIAAYPSETVTIQHPDATAGIQLTGSVHSYLTFQDLIIDGINGTNSAISAIVYLSQGANHIRLVRVEIKNGWSSGLNIFSSGVTSSFNEISDSLVHGNGRWPVTNSGSGMYIDATDTLISGNQVYSNGGYGIQVRNDRNRVTRNIIHNNGLNHADTIGPAGGSTSYALEFGAAVNPHTNDGIADNNLIYSDRGGVLIYTYSANTKVYNNTVYGCAADGIAVQYLSGTAYVTNNIVYSNGAAIVDYGGHLGGSLSQGGNFTSDPGFVDAPGGNFNLTPSSPARGTGYTLTDVVGDIDNTPRETPYDPGAYEYVPPGLSPGPAGSSVFAYATNALKWAPTGAAGAALTPSGTGWANSAKVQILASAPADLVICGLCVTPSSWSFSAPDEQFEIGVCIGGVGVETEVATFKGGSRLISTLEVFDAHNAFNLAIGAGVIPSGSRVSLVLRKKGTNTSTWYAALSYYQQPIVGTFPVTTQHLRCAPSAADLITIATNNGWADPGSYTTLIASAAADLALVGVVIQPNNNSIEEYELVLARGAAASETIFCRLPSTSATYFSTPSLHPIVNPNVRVSAGDRVSAKAYCRGVAAGTVALDVGLLYYHRPL